MKSGTQLTVVEKRCISVRRILSMANQFAAFACQCADGAKLKGAFTSYRAGMIEALMAPYDWSTHRADVLEIEPNGHFRLGDASHGASHLELPYDMRVQYDENTRKALKPGNDGGIAPFCCWAALSSRQPGFGITDLTGEQSQFNYYQEKTPENFREFRQFSDEAIPSLYRSPPQGAKPTYQGMLSTAIVSFETADAAPLKGYDLFCHGTMHILSEKGCEFEMADGLYLLACAPGFGLLYSSFAKARLDMARLYTMKLPEKISQELDAELVDAAKCLQHHLYNAFACIVRRIVEHICLEEGTKRHLTDALSLYRTKEESLTAVVDRLNGAGLPGYVAGRLKELAAFGDSAAHTGKAEVTSQWAALAWENVEWIVEELYARSGRSVRK